MSPHRLGAAPGMMRIWLGMLETDPADRYDADAFVLATVILPRPRGRSRLDALTRGRRTLRQHQIVEVHQFSPRRDRVGLHARQVDHGGDGAGADHARRARVVLADGVFPSARA